MVQLKAILISLTLATSTFAHPGHDVAEEATERAEFFRRNPRSFSSCSSKIQARDAVNHARRHALANSLRAERGLACKPVISRRDFVDYNFIYHYAGNDITLGNREMALFSDNSSCILQTDVTEGPYYVTGELIRNNVTDGQGGIPLTLDIQIIDTSTCEPVSALWMDLWHANATGVYSGVVANGNGNSNDTTNLNSTAMRGIQMTDSNGIVQFHTVFPGHYTGRATHIHVLTHNPNSTTHLLNGTLSSPNVTSHHASHVGQIFFDQSLISTTETVAPYSDNEQTVTLNSEDSILAQEANTTDPYAEYIWLGDSPADGLLAWISIGIDPTEEISVSNAATYYKNGGVANNDSSFVGGGGVGGDGAAPSGAMPSGSSGMITATATMEAVGTSATA